MKNTPTAPLSTNQSDKAGIVLNRMYTGSYLSSNLGHEVINMFQADNERYYLYLNAKGNFAAEGKEVGTMLLVRGIGNGRIEVVGMAKNLKRFNSANCTLSRDLGVINEKVRNEQNVFLNKIKYGKVSILDIFGEGGQQSIYISYWVKKDDFYTPKEGVRIIIEFPPQKKKNDQKSNNKLDAYKKSDQKEVKEIEEGKKKIITVRLKGHNFSSTSLHQYILEDKKNDLTCLREVCYNMKGDVNPDYWESKNIKIDSSEEGDKHEVSLFDICQIQNDENKFSNALSFFIMKYKDLWETFLKEQLKKKFSIEEEVNIVSVAREEHAKVDKTGWKDVTGGRIDLLIRTENSYIIIENKIGSNIIQDKEDKNGEPENDENGNPIMDQKKDEKKKTTQLERYYNYVEYIKWEEEKRLNEEKSKLTEEGEIAKLDAQIGKIQRLRILGFVLSPNYNQPEEDELKIYNRSPNISQNPDNQEVASFKKLSYKEIYEWLSGNAQNLLLQGKDYDANFKAFYDAMKKHKYEYENEALYEDMKNTFLARIKELEPSHDTNNNA